MRDIAFKMIKVFVKNKQNQSQIDNINTNI